MCPVWQTRILHICKEEEAFDAAMYVSMVNTTTGTFDCTSFVSRK